MPDLPKSATKAELRREIAELREFGRQMANVCFNLGENYRYHAGGKTVSQTNLQIMYELAARWDLIKRSESR